MASDIRTELLAWIGAPLTYSRKRHISRPQNAKLGTLLPTWHLVCTTDALAHVTVPIARSGGAPLQTVRMGAAARQKRHD